MLRLMFAVALTALAIASAAQAGPAEDRKAAMAKFGFMRGVWAGPATGSNPDGSQYAVRQTERMGPMLSGDVVVVEGRYAGTFEIKPTDDGYVWEIPAGPVILRYTATVKDGHWREVGERIMPGKPAVQIFEMNLTKVGDTAWPAGDPVPMSAGK
jgi:hypothetical protein